MTRNAIRESRISALTLHTPKKQDYLVLGFSCVFYKC